MLDHTHTSGNTTPTVTILRRDAPEPPTEADTFSTGRVFRAICGRVTGEVTHHAYLARNGTLTVTYSASMEGCGELAYQEDPETLCRMGLVASALGVELAALRAQGMTLADDERAIG